MRSLLQDVINALLSADADAVAGAEYGRPSSDRVAQRNGYRHRDLDTRVGTIDVAVPKLRTGTSLTVECSAAGRWSTFTVPPVSCGLLVCPLATGRRGRPSVGDLLRRRQVRDGGG